jgi:hypothetical protein
MSIRTFLVTIIHSYGFGKYKSDVNRIFYTYTIETETLTDEDLQIVCEQLF